MGPFNTKKFSLVSAAPIADINYESIYQPKIDDAFHAKVDGINDLQRFMRQRHHFETRFYYANLASRSNPANVEEFLHRAEVDARTSDIAVCAIENISPSILARVGHAWKIDPAFFALHVSNPEASSLWQPYEWDGSTVGAADFADFDQLVGIYEYPDMELDIDVMRKNSINYCDRLMFKDGKWPVNCTTNVTYLRVSPTLYLYLVDPAVQYNQAIRSVTSRRPVPSIRFPYSQSNGGLPFPAVDLQRTLTPMQGIEHVYAHDAPVIRMFQRSGAFPKVPLIYLLSSCVWFTKMDHLDKTVREISFGELLEPNSDTAIALHCLREEVANMRRSLSQTCYYTSPGIEAYFNRWWREEPYPKSLTPPEAHKLALERTEDLNKFILESFQLLMNTISIRDSQMSIDLSRSAVFQNNQGILLTRLALVYLPLTLSTGIFGMNISQLNDSGQSIWVFIVTCAVALIVTYCYLLFQMRRLHKKNEARLHNL